MPPKGGKDSVKQAQNIKNGIDTSQTNSEVSQSIDRAADQLMSLQQQMGEIGNEGVENILDVAFRMNDEGDVVNFNEILGGLTGEQEGAKSTEEQIAHIQGVENQLSESSQLLQVPGAMPVSEPHSMDQLKLIGKAQDPENGKNFKVVREQAKSGIGAGGWIGRVFSHAVFGVFTAVQSAYYAMKRAITGKRRRPITWKDEESRKKASGELKREELTPQEQELSEIQSAADDQEIMSNVRRRPVVWEKMIAEDSGMDPYVSVEVSTDGKSGDVMSTVHASLSMNYTRFDPISNRNQRYKVKFGFWTAGGMFSPLLGLGQLSRGATIPGQLRNDADVRVNYGKRYGANNKQINHILAEAENYEGGGYNMLKRNCTTFVAELTQNAGIPTQDILQEKDFDLGAMWLVVPLIPLLAPVIEPFKGNVLENAAQKPDKSYGKDGQMRVNQQQLDDYYGSTDNTIRFKGVSPNMAIAGIKNSGPMLLHANSGKLSEEDRKRFDLDEKINLAVVKAQQIARSTVKTTALNDDFTKLQEYLTTAVENLFEITESISTADTRDAARRNTLRSQAVKLLADAREYVSGVYFGAFGGDSRFYDAFLDIIRALEDNEFIINDAYQQEIAPVEEQDTAQHIRTLFAAPTGGEESRISSEKTRFGVTANDDDLNRMMTLGDNDVVALVKAYGSAGEGVRALLKFKNLQKRITALLGEKRTPQQEKRLNELRAERKKESIRYNYYLAAKSSLRYDVTRKGMTQEDASFAFRELPSMMSDVAMEEGRADSIAAAYQALAYEKIFGGTKKKMGELVAAHGYTETLFTELSAFFLERMEREDGGVYIEMIMQGMIQPGMQTEFELISTMVDNFYSVYVLPLLQQQPGFLKDTEAAKLASAYRVNLLTGNGEPNQKIQLLLSKTFQTIQGDQQ